MLLSRKRSLIHSIPCDVVLFRWLVSSIWRRWRMDFACVSLFVSAIIERTVDNVLATETRPYGGDINRHRRSGNRLPERSFHENTKQDTGRKTTAQSVTNIYASFVWFYRGFYFKRKKKSYREMSTDAKLSHEFSVCILRITSTCSGVLFFCPVRLQAHSPNKPTWNKFFATFRRNIYTIFERPKYAIRAVIAPMMLPFINYYCWSSIW